MKIRKVITTSMWVTCLLLTTLYRNNVSANKKSFENTIASELGIDYQENKDKTTIKYGDVVSNTLYNNSGKPVKVESKSKDNQTVLLNTSLEYDKANKIESIETLNQNISFSRDNEVLNDFKLNGTTLFENIVEENKITQEFANNTSIVKEMVDKQNYSISYDNDSNYLITTDINGNPIKVENIYSNQISNYTYDDFGNLTSLENGSFYINRTDTTFLSTYYDKTLRYEKNNNKIKISLDNNPNQFILEIKEDSDGNVDYLLNNETLYQYSQKDANSDIYEYIDCLSNVESLQFSKLGYLTSIKANDELVRSYKYDDFGKLIKSSSKNRTTGYDYDNSGNLLIETNNKNKIIYKYENANNLNQLTAVNDTKLFYDEFGNLTSFGNISYNWEAGQLLTKLNNNGVVTNYEYGVDKYRTKKSTNGENTYYQYFNGLFSCILPR